LVLTLGLVVGLAACSGDGDADPSVPPSDPVVEASLEPTPGPSAEASDEPEAGSSADPSAEASPTPEPIEASADLEALTVDGEPPVVTVPAPWGIDKSRNKVLRYGDGPTVPTGGLVKVNYVGVDGRTGEVFDSSFETGSPVAFSLNGVVAGFAKGLAGQRVGSRVLLAMPGSDGYDGSDQTAIGIEQGDSLIFVVDLIEIPLAAAEGTPATVPAGWPTVEGTADRPTLTLPAGATFPTAAAVQPVIAGSGSEAVTATAQIQVNFTEYAWSPDGSFRFIRQTYGNAPVSGTLSGALAGWQSLVGVAQGSRVLLVVPPDQGYPKGDAKIGVNQGDASVFLVDVLFA
jgi:peptidylprolyl isomerase